MSTRLLYTLSAITCLLVALLYWKKDDSLKASTQKKPRFDYWAEDILAQQTDSQGRLELEVSAKRLEHEYKNNILHLKQIDAQWHRYPANTASTHAQVIGAKSQSRDMLSFSAKQAAWQQDSNVLDIAGGVKAHHTRLSKQGAQPQPDTEFSTPSMKAYLTEQRIQAGSPVLFRMGKSTIQAQTLYANLDQGEFRFEKLQARHQPSF